MSLFFIFILLFSIYCASQELVGPDRPLSGTLATFEVVPAQEVSWSILTPSLNPATYQVDTGLSKLYFASPEQGRYAVIAGIVHDGKPELLVKTFYNSEEDERLLPIPPATSLETWITTQLPVLVKSNDLVSESRLVADCFEQIVRRIDEGNIRTVHNAHAQLQIALTGTLSLASPTAVTDWTPFLVELSRQLETELGERVNDIAIVKTVLQGVGNAVRTLELPTGNSTPLRKTVNPDNRKTQNRIFRNILSN